MNGRCALVTGAASGIGAEFCRQLTADGWLVLRVDRQPCADGDEAHTLQLDLTLPDAATRVASWLENSGLVPDLLINNAGIFDFAKVNSLSPQRIDLYIDLHVRAVSQLCRAIAPMMVARGSGMILNMSSMSCWMPMPGIALYAATKAYIRVFSRALRLELRDSGVSVTVACPGGIATDLFGLPPKLQRLGVKVGALYTPRRFVKGALRATLRRRKQYVNGPVNRLAIVAVGM
ncbi:MAG: SDR family NAD(P)-dependent oxidoreductase, partial [Muribaculaceae bacterium]|nr:SDR family NAD(P)-dependent oxidoreductase [Muribaculaceae bacterium]